MDQNQDLDNIDYTYKHLFKAKWIITALCICFLVLVSVIPIGDKFDAVIQKAITSSGCPIKYSNYEFKFFAPRIELSNLLIPRRCTNLSQDINLEKTALYLQGPSFSPLGFAMRLKTQYGTSPIDAKLIVGFSSITVHIKNDPKDQQNWNVINLADIGKLQKNFKVAGHIHLSNVYTQLTYAGQIANLKLNVASKDFKIPGQNIQIFKIGTIDIGNMLLQAELKNGSSLELKQFTLGKDGSAIIANFKGSSKLKMRRIKESTLKIRGELALSPKFQEKYAWTNILLGKFDKKDNYYQIEVSGKFGSPKFTSAR